MAFAKRSFPSVNPPSARECGLVRTLIVSLVATFGVIAPASQGYAESAPPPESRVFLHSNGVDLISLTARVAGPSVSIGNLSYSSYFDTGSMTWRSNFAGGIQSSGATYTVTLFGASQKFQLSSGVYNPLEGQTSTLTYNSGTNDYTLLLADGSTAVFDKDIAAAEPLQANEGLITTFTRPSGEITSFTYHTLSTGSGGKRRLQSVTNNLGYQIKFEYAGNSDNADGQRLVKITGINNAVDYCDPTANGCTSLTKTWPSVTFAVSGNVTTVTDSASIATAYTIDVTSGAGTVEVDRASGAKTVYTIASSKVTGVSNGSASEEAGADSYSQSGSTTIQTTVSHTVGGESAGSTVLQYTAATKLPTSFNDSVVPRTYTYYSDTRLKRVTESDGSYVEYSYDSRGNVTQTKNSPKTGSSLSPIYTYATFLETCSNAVICNRPTAVTDARGNTTTFTYDGTHGGVLSITLPEPTSGADQPQTRTTYAQHYAWIKNGFGNIVQAASAIYLPTEASSCKKDEAPACVGTADETKTTTTYQSGSSSVASNLLPVSVTTAAGDSSLSATVSTTYNHLSQSLSVDGPLSGSADSVYSFYDDIGRAVGVVTPDPDGGGSLKYRATKTSFNNDGLVASVEIGTVTTVPSTTTAFLSAFTSSQKVQSSYDDAGRLARSDFMVGSTIKTVKQYSYEAGRLKCEAIRMNPAVFGSLPSSACTASTEGAAGPDRITTYTYDYAGRVTAVVHSKSALNSTDNGFTETRGYVPNTNRVAWIKDAGGQTTPYGNPETHQRTNYEYDGFGRLAKTTYPYAYYFESPIYEEFTYDAGSNVTQVRRRDASTVSTTYDALNRPTFVDASVGTTNDTTTTYDNFSRPLTVSANGQMITNTYDALGRLATTAGALGTVSYQYDAAGRRTRMTWPDSFYVTYEYDAASRLTAIKESGSTALAEFTYDDLGRRTSLQRGNGVDTTYDFDDISRLEEIASDLSGSGDDLTKTFTRNQWGQITVASLSNNAYAATPALGDWQGVNNIRNQLYAEANTSVTHAYDGRANYTGTGAGTTYSYDQFNQLTGAAGVTLAYDPIGRLTKTTSTTSVVTQFLYDGVDLIAEYDSAGTTLLRRYVHGPGTDEPIVWYEGSGTSDRRYLVADERGSVVAVTNASGAATNKNSYDDYGAPGSGNIGRFQYTGQIYLPETGLYHYKARVYSPTLGRFIQPDPIGYLGGMNLYAYVNNDPINKTDPSGTEGLTDRWAWEHGEAYDLGFAGTPPETETNLTLIGPTCKQRPWMAHCWLGRANTEDAAAAMKARLDSQTPLPRAEGGGGTGGRAGEKAASGKKEEGKYQEKRCNKGLVNFGNSLIRNSEAHGNVAAEMVLAGGATALVGAGFDGVGAAPGLLFMEAGGLVGYVATAEQGLGGIAHGLGGTDFEEAGKAVASTLLGGGAGVATSKFSQVEAAAAGLGADALVSSMAALSPEERECPN